MKRTLVAATTVALLLGGCATGDTGHLDPEIQPDIIVPAPQRTPQGDSATEDAEGSETRARHLGRSGERPRGGLRDGGR